MALNIVRQSSNLAPLLGATTENAATDSSSTSGLNGLLKAILRDFRARIPVLSAGRIPVATSQAAAATVTLTNISVTTTNSILFAANLNRLYWSIEHKGAGGEGYVTEGATATASNGKTFSVDMELNQDCLFLGVINIIGSANFSIRATEYSL